MEVLIQDKQLHIEPTSSSSSSPSSPLVSPPYTPSFQPNSFEASYAKANQAKPIDVSLDQFDLHDLGAELDLGDSTSKLLRVGTQRAHVNAEHSKGAEKLLKGELGLQEYVRWLAILWRVYDALELGLSEHSSNNVLEPTYNPAMLARAGPLANDITYLLAQLPSDQVTSPVTATPSGPLPPFPLPPFLAELWTHPEPALQTYLSHIKDLSSSSKSSPRLLAHAYVRYLGDLSGGQFIAARLRKTYELGEAGGKGLEFYHFNLDHGPEALAEESRADKKKRLEEIKDWYRKGMDEGVGEDSDLKVTLVKEANLAFILNTHLFSLIRADGPPPSTVKLTPASQSQSLVGAGQQLRYFETRELARLEKQKEQERLNPPKPPLKWYEIAERTALFTATVVLGWGLSTYGMPWITENAGKYLGSGSSLSGEL